ncbi:MAG: hypothetical protein WDM80_10585 [Limisphaerales bacterium]
MKGKFVFLGWLVVALIAGCDKAGGLGGEKTKTCFACQGVGKTSCPNGSSGWKDCPGNCLKLSQGVWEHMDVAGHPATDVWRKFYKSGGGYQAWNQNHVGDVVEMRDGVPVNIGKCSICGGTGRVKCPVCDGTGNVVCPVCGGKKVVPESWTALDNPTVKTRPSQFKLKDGRTLVGRRLIIIGDQITIHTATGDVVVKAADIVAEEKPPAQK